jgi:hypothetical protein
MYMIASSVNSLPNWETAIALYRRMGMAWKLPGHGMFKRKSMEGPKLTRERLAKSIILWKAVPETHVVNLIIDALMPVGRTRATASNDLDRVRMG